MELAFDACSRTLQLNPRDGRRAINLRRATNEPAHISERSSRGKDADLSRTNEIAR
jgi:hypothetical protein